MQSAEYSTVYIVKINPKDSYSILVFVLRMDVYIVRCTLDSVQYLRNIQNIQCIVQYCNTKVRHIRGMTSSTVPLKTLSHHGAVPRYAHCLTSHISIINTQAGTSFSFNS